MKGRMWDQESEFDKEMDKSKFRDYNAACDRVKAFYKEQHGKYPFVFANHCPLLIPVASRKANHGFQH